MVRSSSGTRRLVVAAMLGLSTAVLVLGRQEEVPERKWATIQEGGLVTAVAIDPLTPARVYAASARALFASEDAGATWTPLAHGAAHHAVTALAIEPGAPSVLYVGTNGGGLLRGGAGNSKFVRIGDGQEPDFVSSITFDPSSRGRVYV